MLTHPLLQAQMGVYHAWMADPTSVAYNLPAVVPFPRSIDLDRLEQALHSIWANRPELHTQFTTLPNGEPRQWANLSLPLPYTHRQLSEKDAQSYINRGFVRPFVVLAGQPLVRFEVIETEEHHYLLYDMHHLIADGLTLSQSFLNTDLPAAYQGKPLQVHPYSLYQHAEAEQTEMQGEQYQRDRQFYQEHFCDLDFTSLSARTSTPWGQRLNATATTDAASLDLWCQLHQVSPAHLFMAAFSIVLSRLSHTDSVAFVALNHGRTDRRLAQAYGMFVSSTPMLVHTDEQQSPLDFIAQLRRWLISTMRHRTYPLTHLCRDLHKTPAITFAFQGTHILEQTTTGGMTTHGYQLTQGTTKNDLSCIIYQSSTHYEVRTEASSALWTQQRLCTLAKAVITCAENLMAHPDSTLADLSILTSDEEEALRLLGQGEQLHYDTSQTIVSLFLQQAQRTPQALAVTDGTTSLTYEELNQRSATHALHLLQQGVQAGDRVVIDTGQCTAFLVEALAIMRIGAAYVPLDAEWPEARKQQIREATQAPPLPSIPPKSALRFRRSLPPIPPQSALRFSRSLPSSPSPSSLAYIIYTSGTTGRPKGIPIFHRALLNLVHSIVHLFGLTSHSRISCHSSVAFDASVEDLFPVLTVGGSVHIMPEAIRHDPAKIYQFILDHHITGGCYTTHLGLLLAQRYPLPQDYLCLGGERLTQWPTTHPRVFNTYGPTEFTVDATYYRLPPSPAGNGFPIAPPSPSPAGNGFPIAPPFPSPAGNGFPVAPPPPIGRPLPNLSALILDHHGHLLPQGEVGELCLSGPQKAANCQDDPYHTGDLARWNDDGQLEYIGRKDRQLKLHGYRIEPEEIEQHLTQTEGIRQAAVLIADKGQHLCAYFTADRPIAAAWLSEQLSLTLPPYMVPDHFIQLPSMPLTTAGKPNYAALPTPETAPTEHAAPANDSERLWCDLFAQVTGTPHVGATDNFFHIGGTSLLVATLQAEALQRGIPLSYSDVFTHPTPRLLANSQRNTPKTDVGDIGQPTSGTSVNRHRGHRLRGNESTPIGTLLLTGSTGFLGRYMLREFLTHETGTAYCLIRANDEQHATERLRQALHQDFGTTLDAHIGTRIIPVASDLLSFTPHQLPAHIDTVIHCAADTRHFAADQSIEQTNIGGTDHITDFCLARQARLIHISTLSIDPHATNPYLHSKAIAEQHVLDAITQQGLDATILRIGNLATPSGQLRGTLAATLQAFLLLSQYPQSLAQLPIDRSPVDQTAHAIRLLTTHPTDTLIHQPYNPHTLTLATLLQQQGNLQAVSDEEFQAALTKALATPSLHTLLVPLLHYQAMHTPNGTLPTLPNNQETTQLLHQLGFEWTIPPQ